MDQSKEKSKAVCYNKLRDARALKKSKQVRFDWNKMHKEMKEKGISINCYDKRNTHNYARMASFINDPNVKHNAVV